MSSTTFPDRRQNTRIPLVISVRERSSRGVVMCVATDISLCGMALKRAADTVMDAPVMLDFQLPGIDGILSIPARFVRQVQTSSIQMSAVRFEWVPEPLRRWFKTAQASVT